MRLGGAGSAAHSVATRAAAEQDDDIAGIAVLTLNISARRSAHDSADLHSLCDIAGMVDLFYMSRRKADLVSIAGVALCGTCDKLLLGKFVLESLGYGNCGICRAGHAHCLIYIASSGERVADRSAKAGSCAAERLDLRGMIVRLVFKEDKPFLRLGPVSIVNFHGYNNRAGVILVRFFLIVKLAVCL